MRCQAKYSYCSHWETNKGWDRRDVNQGCGVGAFPSLHAQCVSLWPFNARSEVYILGNAKQRNSKEFPLICTKRVQFYLKQCWWVKCFTETGLSNKRGSSEHSVCTFLPGYFHKVEYSLASLARRKKQKNTHSSIPFNQLQLKEPRYYFLAGFLERGSWSQSRWGKGIRPSQWLCGTSAQPGFRSTGWVWPWLTLLPHPYMLLPPPTRTHKLHPPGSHSTLDN